MKRNLAFAAFAVLPLAACSSPSDFDRGSGRAPSTAYYRLEPPADVEVAKLGAAWFDGFVQYGRSYHKLKATPEEIDAYMHGRDQTSFRAKSLAQIGSVSR